MTNTGLETKYDDISHLNFNVTCDYMDCEDRATHRLICALCPQFEFMCLAHAQNAIHSPKGSWIIFDKSCKHRVDLFDCRKEPI
jgi:hypothetical protein